MHGGAKAGRLEVLYDEDVEGSSRQPATPKEMRGEEDLSSKTTQSGEVTSKDAQPSLIPLWDTEEDIGEEAAKQSSLNEEAEIDPSIEERKSTMLALRWCPHQINYLAQVYGSADL